MGLRQVIGSREGASVAAVSFFLSLIQLKAKLTVTRGWFSGVLDQNHSLLLHFKYLNNEQSRVLQWLIPEALSRSLGLTVQHAYLVQRLVFVWVALVLFYAYLRKWFSEGVAFAGVAMLAAMLPLPYQADLQESAPLLMVTFLLGLWAVRERRRWLLPLILLVGAVNNETTLSLLAVVFFDDVLSRQPGARLRATLPAFGRTLLAGAPAIVWTACIRWYTLDRPHLGGAWHWPDNWRGILGDLARNPLDYWSAGHLHFVLLFGALWVFAYRGFRRKPPFIQAGLILVPLFILPHLITGVISESRQMIPLAFTIIPAAFMSWFALDEEQAPGLSHPS